MKTSCQVAHAEIKYNTSYASNVRLSSNESNYTLLAGPGQARLTVRVHVSSYHTCTSHRRRPPFPSRLHQRRRVSPTCLCVSTATAHTCVSGRQANQRTQERCHVGRPARRACTIPMRTARQRGAPAWAWDEDRRSADCLSSGAHPGRNHLAKQPVFRRCSIQGLSFVPVRLSLPSSNGCYNGVAAPVCGTRLPRILSRALSDDATAFPPPLTDATGVLRCKPDGISILALHF
jgi:hypothetical protein